MDIEVLDDVAQEPPPPPVMDTILTWIGFEQGGTRAGLVDEGFESFVDTRLYEVEFQDAYRTSLAANAIAENVFAQIDDEGNRHILFQEIIDHQTNGKQVLQQDAFITTRTGTRRRWETTIGWELLVQWKDQSTTWVSLKDMKEVYPVQAAEYNVQARIAEEPAFPWWAPYMLKKQNPIIAKIKSKYWLRTHKFGIKIPKSVKVAKRNRRRKR